MSERAILHIDMNNFYASVECMLNPDLKNIRLQSAAVRKSGMESFWQKTIRRKHLEFLQGKQYGKQNRSAQIL